MERITSLLYKIVTCLLLMISVIPCSCNHNDELIDDEKAPFKMIRLDEEKQPYLSASNKFAINLFEKTSDLLGTNKNFTISPLSLHMNLSVLANGMSGATLNRLTGVLLPDFNGEVSLEQLNELNKILAEKLPQTDAKATFLLANSIWIDSEIDVKETFWSRIVRDYGANIFSFAQGSGSVINEVNNWCSDATLGTINNILDKVPYESVLLVNALFFQQTWSSPFDSANTKKSNFFCESGEKNLVPMMYKEYEGLVYADEKSLRTVLKYGNGAFEMHLIKPDEGVSVRDAVSGDRGDSYLRKIKLKMPKLSLNTDLNFKEILGSMGLSDIWDSSSDYSELSSDAISIESIRQKTRLEINEDGTKVTSVSLSGLVNTSAGEPPEVVEFYLDHPFAFEIRELSTGVIIAMGKICNL